MAANRPRPFTWLYVAAACVLASASALVLVLLLQSQDATPVRSAGVEFFDVAEGPRPTVAPPEALVGKAMPVPTATPVPRATPSPTPGPRWPTWVQSQRDTDLETRSGLLPTLRVAAGSYLKVSGAEKSRLLVYYGGDGNERDPVEGWVASADVLPSPAPRWVTLRRGAALEANAGLGSPISAWLLNQTVLEVVEDHGSTVRVFYLGDGRTREAQQGWLLSADVGAAGAMLSAEARGVRVLNPAEVASLKSGDGMWLKVPFRTQLDGSASAGANCGPASAGMALEFFGVLETTADLRALANELQGTSDPESGVSLETLQEMIERFGLVAEDLYLGRDFKRWGIDDVRRHLGLGHLVIPELRFRLMPGRAKGGYADHYVVLSGIRGNDFIYEDPDDADGSGRGRLMSAEILAKAWGASEYPFAALAVARP